MTTKSSVLLMIRALASRLKIRRQFSTYSTQSTLRTKKDYPKKDNKTFWKKGKSVLKTRKRISAWDYSSQSRLSINSKESSIFTQILKENTLDRLSFSHSNWT
jgi:hypothetical protein